MRAKQLKVVIPIGVIVLGLMTWAGIAVTNQVANPIVNTIRGQITVPSVLNNSRVLAGNPFAFLLWESPAAKIKLSSKGMSALVGTEDVFADCRKAGRECNVPSWAPPLVLLDFDGIDMPEDARCVQSYAAGSNGRHDARVICVDQAKGLLYYYGWDDRAR
jgi:hypothetical protein